MRPDTLQNQQRVVARSKLMLDTSLHTKVVRDKLRATLDILKGDKWIKEDHDVIAHFLTSVFEHTKDQLQLTHQFGPTSKIEFVLCVPVNWSQKACRLMQTAMETAIRKSGIYNLPTDSVDNLFIVSEPEAAATAVLVSTKDIRVGRNHPKSA